MAHNIHLFMCLLVISRYHFCEMAFVFCLCSGWTLCLYLLFGFASYLRGLDTSPRSFMCFIPSQGVFQSKSLYF